MIISSCLYMIILIFCGWFLLQPVTGDTSLCKPGNEDYLKWSQYMVSDIPICKTESVDFKCCASTADKITWEWTWSDGSWHEFLKDHVDGNFLDNDFSVRLNDPINKRSYRCNVTNSTGDSLSHQWTTHVYKCNDCDDPSGFGDSYIFKDSNDTESQIVGFGGDSEPLKCTAIFDVCKSTVSKVYENYDIVDILWTHDGDHLNIKNKTKYSIILDREEDNQLVSTLKIYDVQDDDLGTYTCYPSIRGYRNNTNSTKQFIIHGPGYVYIPVLNVEEAIGASFAVLFLILLVVLLITYYWYRIRFFFRYEITEKKRNDLRKNFTYDIVLVHAEYAPDDVFASRFGRTIEKVYGYRVYIPRRDAPAGGNVTYGYHDVIRNGCTVVFIVSPTFVDFDRARYAFDFCLIENRTSLVCLNYTPVTKAKWKEKMENETFRRVMSMARKITWNSQFESLLFNIKEAVGHESLPNHLTNHSTRDSNIILRKCQFNFRKFLWKRFMDHLHFIAPPVTALSDQIAEKRKCFCCFSFGNKGGSDGDEHSIASSNDSSIGRRHLIQERTFASELPSPSIPSSEAGNNGIAVVLEREDNMPTNPFHNSHTNPELPIEDDNVDDTAATENQGVPLRPRDTNQRSPTPNRFSSSLYSPTPSCNEVPPSFRSLGPPSYNTAVNNQVDTADTNNIV